MHNFSKTQANALKPFAQKYIWWKTPEASVLYPLRVVAQVMNIGDFDDMQSLRSLVGEDVLRQTISNAEAGWFNARSWHYWHYVLGLADKMFADARDIPPLPVRKFDEKI